MSANSCCVDGCASPVASRGHCNRHVKKLLRYGNALAGYTKARNGSGSISDDGYRMVTSGGRVVREHVLMAERAIGNPLPPGAIVHHVDEDKLNNDPSNLVVCPDQTYHMLIHRRMRAFAACGHYDWLPCRYCGQYDAPANLRVYDTRRQLVAMHAECNQQYQREQRARRAESQVDRAVRRTNEIAASMGVRLPGAKP